LRPFWQAYRAKARQPQQDSSLLRYLDAKSDLLGTAVKFFALDNSKAPAPLNELLAWTASRQMTDYIWRKMGVASLAVTVLSGCADMTDKQCSTAIGTGLGAVGGAAIGSFSGNAGWGALIGAGAGALGGYAVGQSRENEQRAYQRGVDEGRRTR